MKILVVDDEADVQPLFLQRFRKELRGGELELSFALSAHEALVYIREHRSDIDLVLSDINMPGMTGLDMLSKIRVEYQDPPPVVMMISAYGDDDNRRHAAERGANGFLTKPVDFALLKEKIGSFKA